MSTVGQYSQGNQCVPGFGNRLVLRWPYLRDVLNCCLFVVFYSIAYRYGMSFSQSCASPFWFPDSIQLCALLLSRRRMWWVFLLVPLPIRFLVAVSPDVPWWFLTTTFAIGSVKGLLTATLLRRFIKNPLHLETVKDCAIYCLFAVVAMPAAAAFAGAAARHGIGHDYWPGWEQWFMGNAMTQLIITPAILYWVVGGSRSLRLLSARQWLEGGLLTTGLIVSGYVAFNVEPAGMDLAEARFYAPVPFLFWAAIRFGMFGASGAITLIAIFAVEAALSGTGLFEDQSPMDSALALQHFLLLRAAPLYVVAILIEQKTGADRSLRESEARFRTVADTAPVMIWMSGTDKRCVYFNQRWLEFTGRPHEAETGDGWLVNVHPDDVAPVVNGYGEAFDLREPFTLEYRLRRHDGQYRWILDQGVPRRASDGEFLGYIGSCVDMTDRKLMDAEAEQQRMELTHVARVSTLGQLATALAHELNQPLGAILRNAEAGELILEENAPDYDEVRAILADIRRDDRRAGAVIDRMKSLLRHRKFEFEAIQPKQLIDQVAVLVRAEMLARRVVLRVELPYGLPAVRGDRVHLQQVLLNLLINGADAINGSPAESRQIEVRAGHANDATVEISVRDTGRGIPEERLGHIFDPFFTTKPDGMGVGLAISKTIIELHAGRIWAENNADGGATFRFTLKTAQPGDPG